MEICGGISWNSVEFRGISWNFVEFRGILWISWFFLLGCTFLCEKAVFVDKNFVEFRGIFFCKFGPFFGPEKKKFFFRPKMFVTVRGISWDFAEFRGFRV